MFILRTQEDVTCAQIGVGLIKKYKAITAAQRHALTSDFMRQKEPSHKTEKNDQTLSTAIFQRTWHSIFTLDQKGQKD